MIELLKGYVKMKRDSNRIYELTKYKLGTHVKYLWQVTDLHTKTTSTYTLEEFSEYLKHLNEKCRSLF
jgi:hypothetical protein